GVLLVLVGAGGGTEVVTEAHERLSLVRVSVRRKNPVSTFAVGSNRATSWLIASPTFERRSHTSTGVPWFTEIGTARELGIVTFASIPTVASTSLTGSPTRASARFTTK